MVLELDVLLRSLVQIRCLQDVLFFKLQVEAWVQVLVSDAVVGLWQRELQVGDVWVLGG